MAEHVQSLEEIEGDKTIVDPERRQPTVSVDRTPALLRDLAAALGSQHSAAGSDKTAALLGELERMLDRPKAEFDSGRTTVLLGDLAKVLEQGPEAAGAEKTRALLDSIRGAVATKAAQPQRESDVLPRGYHLYEYRIDSVLGRGGFGITYLATDVNLNAQVAVKEYLPEELFERVLQGKQPLLLQKPVLVPLALPANS
jgi:hypothetical protein